MIGGAQIRAARALLDWTASDLAKKSGVARMTVQRFERHQGVPPSWPEKLSAVQAALELGGVRFTGRPDLDPGVSLKQGL
jgi:transcriptional regulator with XRE-family HTH domain